MHRAVNNAIEKKLTLPIVGVLAPHDDGVLGTDGLGDEVVDASIRRTHVSRRHTDDLLDSGIDYYYFIREVWNPGWNNEKGAQSAGEIFKKKGERERGRVGWLGKGQVGARFEMSIIRSEWR